MLASFQDLLDSKLATQLIMETWPILITRVSVLMIVEQIINHPTAL